MNMDIKEVDVEGSKNPEDVGTQTDLATNGNVGVPLTFLNSLKSVLEVSIARGAYRANEIKVVGTLYESLDNLITNNK
jgi:hypothetical protein